ncbi:MAG: thiolase family protein [Bacteroidia bacterium]|nr:thiolase family protein [Bacteroidia bacterium]
MKKAVFLIDAVRTPIGSYGGSLKDIPVSTLATIPAKALITRNNLDSKSIQVVVMGNVCSAGDVHNPARNVAFNCGLDDDVSTYTVNRLCGSGLQAVIHALMEIETDNAQMTMAVGAENMSRYPQLLLNRWGTKYGSITLIDGTSEILSDPMDKYPAGLLGENCAREYGISRESCDQFAWESQQKYLNAHTQNTFANQMIPVEVGGKIGTFSQDEHPRQTTLEKMATLSPVFSKNGVITAGNASGINDGAAAALFADEETIKSNHLKPIARIVGYAAAGIDHNLMGYAPTLATQKLLKKTGLKINDLDLIEINEAFAAQVLAVEKGLEWDRNKVNVNGGAIALGHPLGMSGVRILTMLAHELAARKAKYGLATICIGGGMGLSIIIENLH